MVMEPAGPAGPPLGDLSLHHLVQLLQEEEEERRGGRQLCS